jgi:hypothetical protein
LEQSYATAFAVELVCLGLSVAQKVTYMWVNSPWQCKTQLNTLAEYVFHNADGFARDRFPRSAATVIPHALTG